MRPEAQTIEWAGAMRGGGLLSRLTRSNVFAWSISLGLHLAVFALFYLTAFHEAVLPRREIIPEARLTAVGPGRLAPVADAPLKIADQRPPRAAVVEQNLRFDKLPEPAVQLTEPMLVTAGGGGAEADRVYYPSSVGGGPGSLGGGDGPGTSLVGLASAGSGGLGLGGPASRFFGQTGNAYKVVYVVDVSASLMIYTDEIVREMRGSIAALVPTQRFHIVLAMPREVREFGPGRLVPAIDTYKTQAAGFIALISGTPGPGKADPVEAMKRAFAAGPELIYFLTDGDYPDIESDLESTLKSLNPRAQVKITTIGFDPAPGPRALLERIARQHGGHCRWVEAK